MSDCIICGKDLGQQPYWKTKCFNCWKKTELKTETIGKKFNRLKAKGVI